MEAKKLVIACILTLSPLSVLAYDNLTTHRELTEEALQLYNRYYPDNQIIDKEAARVVDGSDKEDEGVRPIKHFFDPVYDRGMEGSETAKVWSQDTMGQGGFAIGPDNYLLGNVTSFYSADSDYSWDRAVFDYAHGDKNRGLEALGHILHLAEDMTVPDHVRNDNHVPYLKGTKLDRWDQTSPYEVYTTDPSGVQAIADDLIREGKKPVIYSSLNQYFDGEAKYTNVNYFSRDTISNKEYKYPAIETTRLEKCADFEEGCSFIINLINGKESRLALRETIVDKKTGKIFIEYTLVDKENLILSDYWQNLSRVAVQNSAGIIKLFFDRVTEEKRTNALLKKNKSLARKGWEKTVDVAEATYGAGKRAIVWTVDATGKAVAWTVDQTGRLTDATLAFVGLSGDKSSLQVRGEGTSTLAAANFPKVNFELAAISAPAGTPVVANLVPVPAPTLADQSQAKLEAMLAQVRTLQAQASALRESLGDIPPADGVCPAI